MNQKSDPAQLHELSREQSVDVRSVGTHAIVWGIVCALVSLACFAVALLGVAGKLHGPGWQIYVPAGVVNAVLAANFVVSGRDFLAAVTRRGCDISQVMTALSHLSRAVLVQIVVALVAIAAVTVAALFVGGT